MSSIMESEVAIAGECFCGEIKYQVEGKLRDARSCHCSRCRKAFSSQASAYALVEPREFKWISGQDLLTSYVSKHGFGLQFCSKCGSTLCGIYNGSIHGVTLGCLNGDPEIEIGKHIYVGSKASWEVMPAGVIQYIEGVPENA
ncbi:GFA family protein [Shewanella sp.]|uniref:GFA family protein n=1 Tax=Shewanella sp. TaxID=50422 RepID=UPI002585368B|nr:GFA family protein [Shewanella sp.]MCJ8305180.1 GFA family protein [Shewanella sp.]